MTAPRRARSRRRRGRPEQVVALMMERLAVGDFYILCPDNETTPSRTRKRIAWAAGDIIENRPALSRLASRLAGRVRARFMQD